MLHNYVVDQGIDLRLQSDGVVVLSISHQTGAEAHGEVVRLHHVLVTVLSHTESGEIHNWTTKGKCFLGKKKNVNKCSETFLRPTHYVPSPSSKKMLGCLRTTKKVHILPCDDRVKHSLVKKSKEVSHDNDDGLWEGGDDCSELRCSLCLVLYF